MTVTNPFPPPTAIRAGARFEGVIVLHRSARIDGQVHGQVLAQEAVWVGEEGRVEGRVEAGEVVVAGELSGEVRARNRIELLPTARVRASLETPRLALAEGSQLEGPCHTGPGRAAD